MRLTSILAAGLILALATPVDAGLFYARQLTELTGEVSHYDLASGSVTRTYPAAIRDIDGLAVDPSGRNLFIGTSNGNALFRLDLASGAVSQVNIPLASFFPSDLTFGPSGDLFLLNQTITTPGQIIRYDVTTNSVEAVLNVAPMSVARGLAVGPNGDLFASNGSGNLVFRIDSNTGAVLQTYNSGLNIPYGVAFGPDGNLYVANFGSQNVVRINVTTGASSVAASGNGLAFPQGLEFGPDGNLYVASASNEVLAFNPTTGALVRRIPVGSGGPEYITFGDIQPTAVPAPSALVLLGAGGLTLLLARRPLRRRQAG